MTSQLFLPDIFLDSGGKQDRFLSHKSNLFPQPPQINLPNINTVQYYLSTIYIIEPLNKSHGSTLATAAGTDQGMCGARLQGNCESWEEG